jgi:hypothetical protein
MNKLKKEFYELKAKFAELGGVAIVLEELKEISSYCDLKIYIEKRERQFWKESTPIATALCNKNIEMAEEYIKNG